MRLRQQLGKLLSTPTNDSLFCIGMLNGLLLCGMTYLALTSSFLTGNVWNGILLMASFRFRTSPALLAAVFFGSYLSQKVRRNLRKTMPVFLACMAALLVLGGLNLGIPYTSSSLPQSNKRVDALCH